MKSHTQLPKGHLKPFSSKNEKRLKTFYLDLSINKIELKDIRDINVIEGYYSAKTEESLNRLVESKFFSFRDEMTRMVNGEKSIKLTYSKHRTVIDYLEILLLRSEFALKTYNENSKCLRSIDHNSFIEVKLENFDKNLLFNQYRVLSLVNLTEVNYILPAMGFLQTKSLYTRISDSGGSHFYIPITPRIALLLVNKKDYNEYLNFSDKSINLNINSEKDIRYLNRCAYMYERSINNKFIVSQTINELRELLSDS